ncbi:MAG: prevent-host-death protein [Bacteroidota bacterium]|jgi:antitoxin (DNA-binding transcriptional repressor) of toxin-antitoxin stability system|nr:prevent-host-death protein [Bacteroidota bacterium]HHU96474.1 type II toxin-antitoxin system Phd/YefM family antitoxin [Petrimonas sp.]
MVIVSSREFRSKQKSYLDKVDEGVEVVITRGKNRSYRIIPVTGDDTLMSKADFFAKIDKALEEAEQGKVTRINSEEELSVFFDSL